MRDDNYITSKRDIRNKRYRRRRRQVMLNRCIFGGILLIILLVVIIIGIKACGGKGSGDSGNDDSGGGAKESQGDTTPDEQTSDRTDDNTEDNSTEDTTTSDNNNLLQYGDETVNDGQRIVVVDAGHGGKDGGSVGPDGALEKDDNLNMAKALKAALEAKGITVYMTRDGDSFPSLEERAALANSKNADLLISVHRNEYSADSGVRGYEAWIHSTKPAKSTDIATRIQSALVAAGISRDRGVKNGTQESPGTNYAVNSQSKCPSVLLEMGFMTNAGDNAMFRNNAGKLAEAMAQAVLEWMEAQGL